jgi:hypothetical protein
MRRTGRRGRPARSVWASSAMAGLGVSAGAPSTPARSRPPASTMARPWPRAIESWAMAAPTACQNSDRKAATASAPSRPASSIRDSPASVASTIDAANASGPSSMAARPRASTRCRRTASASATARSTHDPSATGTRNRPTWSAATAASSASRSSKRRYTVIGLTPSAAPSRRMLNASSPSARIISEATATISSGVSDPRRRARAASAPDVAACAVRASPTAADYTPYISSVKSSLLPRSRRENAPPRWKSETRSGCSQPTGAGSSLDGTASAGRP